MTAVGVAALLTAPWMVSRAWVAVGGAPALGTGATVFTSGLAVLGASFLLAWGAETAEKDVPRAFALAVLAVLAVAPEYAVDALYAWEAGANAGTEYGAGRASLAVANMTGANRILIGLGWAAIAVFTVVQARKTADPAVLNRPGGLRDAVELDRDLSTELTFLLAATAMAFLVPLGPGLFAGGPIAGGIGMVDTAVLVGIYGTYIAIVARGEVDGHGEQVGVPAYLQAWSRPRRVATVLTLFAYSAAAILVAVEPFAHGLEDLGLQFGIPDFFMVQWIAPLASESPELIVVAYLVNKARSTAGFNALISSKLNQWTLLIGTLAVVYSVAAGEASALPLDRKQTAEIWLTAGQSLFAIAVVTNFEISVREAVVLFALFASQVAVEFGLILTTPEAAAERYSIWVLYAYTALYLVLAAGILVRRRDDLRALVARTGRQARRAFGGPATTPESGD